MRQFKFRAWDKEKETMRINIETGIYEDPDEFMDFGRILELERFIVMQYTGLKDINGKEIYEGDIVYDEHDEEYGKVIFEGGEYLCEWETYADSLSNELGQIEVIGNIYENKELLNEED